jgi:hypothetical protein
MMDLRIDAIRNAGPGVLPLKAIHHRFYGASLIGLFLNFSFMEEIP